MGIHCGEAARTATGLVGLEVHRAARVAAVAYGGQVVLSETAAALIRDSLPPGTALRDLGVHRLKDLGRPEQIFQLSMAGLPGEFPPLRSLGNPALANNLPVQLATFVGRAKEQGAGFAVDEETGPLVASICRRLDGMPLAIELAAARLRSLSLTGLRDRLDQRFRLLTGGSRTALARQQTLRATVEWSYSLLTGAEQVVLRRLSVFAESFDLDAAEAVCGFGDVEAFDVAGLLGSLVDKSLVVAEPAGAALRYRLLETIRQFAAERLAEGLARPA